MTAYCPIHYPTAIQNYIDCDTTDSIKKQIRNQPFYPNTTQISTKLAQREYHMGGIRKLFGGVPGLMMLRCLSQWLPLL
jgi:hypothetical protein